MAESSIVEELWARRNDTFRDTGKLPVEFPLTPEEYCQLRALVKPGASWFGFAHNREFPCTVFGIPVRIAGVADGE